MELTSPRFKNFHTKWSDEKGKPITTISIGKLKETVDWLVKSCDMNNMDPNEVPVFLNFSDDLYVVQGTSFGQRGDIGPYATISTYSTLDKMVFVAPDTEDPSSTEVEWKSRGVSDGIDVAGYVRSKPAGIRLLHMVMELLGKEDPKQMKSWLDFREREPNYIQFKFRAEEFNVFKVDELAKKNGDKLSKEILKECLVQPKQ